MPTTNPVNAQLCDITDLARDVYNLMVRMAELESRQNQLINSNVTTVYLSDFSAALGVIDSGILNQAVVIVTTGNYAMYAYSAAFDPASPIEVEGNITIETPVLNTPYVALPTFVRNQTVGFQVNQSGVYSFTATVSTHYLINPLGGSSHTYGAAGWNMIIAAGVDPHPVVSGDGEKGLFLERRIGGVHFGTGTATGPQDIYTDNTQPNSNISTSVLFRLDADDFIRVNVYPHYIIDAQIGGTTPTEPLDVAFQITAWNYTVLRVGDL